MTQAAFLHAESDTVRFWVQVEGEPVGATVSRTTLHHRYRPDGINEDPLETYGAHEQDLGDAVRRRVAGGSREPVMLREYDLRTSAT